MTESFYKHPLALVDRGFLKQIHTRLQGGAVTRQEHHGDAVIADRRQFAIDLEHCVLFALPYHFRTVVAEQCRPFLEQ